YQLLPNHLLNLKNKNIVRFYPRMELPTITVEEATYKIVELVKKQVNLLKDEKILLSLSGGLDSRSSLALLKDISSSIELFTYYLTDSSDPNYKGNKI